MQEKQNVLPAQRKGRTIDSQDAWLHYWLETISWWRTNAGVYNDEGAKNPHRDNKEIFDRSL